MGGGGDFVEGTMKKRGQELGIDCTELHKVTFTFRCEGIRTQQLVALFRRAVTHKQEAFYSTESRSDNMYTAHR